jgi:hypothetical protein
MNPLHQQFLSGILPALERHAKVYFRHLHADRKEEAVAETVALGWKWFRRMAQRGKDARQFPTAFASFAAKAVKSGRRVCGQEKPRDVMSGRAQRRHGFYVGKLPDISTESGNPLAEALHDNTKTPPPEAAAFRCDFPVWRGRFDQRRRRVLDALALGHRTKEVARRFHLSEARVSQMRREYMCDWDRFTG